MKQITDSLKASVAGIQSNQGISEVEQRMAGLERGMQDILSRLDDISKHLNKG